MNTKLINSAAGVINAALTQNRTAAGIALALDSAQLLLTPETTAELAALQARVAESKASPLAWARLLDAKSLDNFLIVLGSATEYEPMEGALSQVEEILRSFRACLLVGAEEQREQTLHDHVITRDAEIERLKARIAELEKHQGAAELAIHRLSASVWRCQSDAETAISIRHEVDRILRPAVTETGGV